MSGRRRLTPALLGAVIGSSAVHAASPPPPISDDERRVLLATSGHDLPSPPVADAKSGRQPPPDLDGRALQRWFDEHYGTPSSPPAPQPPAPVDDATDSDAEKRLLEAIERRRREP